MSRGISSQQRDILAALATGPATVWDLVRLTHEHRNYSRYESVARALHSLIRRGAVVRIDGWPKQYATPEIAAHYEHREMLMLAYCTAVGRAEIIRQMGRIPTLKEWLSVGNCQTCDVCASANISQRPPNGGAAEEKLT
jgi:hypothetical protein